MQKMFFINGKRIFCSPMFAAYSNTAYIINVAIRVNRLQMDRLHIFSFSSLKKKKKKKFSWIGATLSITGLKGCGGEEGEGRVAGEIP